MSFLDRFKPQPRWKHTDAAVRVAAVGEIPDDPANRDTLQELAASDEDVRVRTAAMERLSDASFLAGLARVEQDVDLRRRITERLVAIAVAPAETDADASLALEGLDDPRQFSTIAKSSPHDTVRASALGRVHEAKPLGSIARHALDSQTALDAVGRISDAAELLNVALKTEHKEAGVAALDRSLDPQSPDARETLDTVVNSGRQWTMCNAPCSRSWTTPRRLERRPSRAGSRIWPEFLQQLNPSVRRLSWQTPRPRSRTPKQSGGICLQTQCSKSIKRRRRVLAR
jgi:hypothetical protein